MKQCPFCAEEIQDAAIKCKHCGSMLPQDGTEFDERIPCPDGSCIGIIIRADGKCGKCGKDKGWKEEKGQEYSLPSASKKKKKSGWGTLIALLAVLYVVSHFFSPDVKDNIEPTSSVSHVPTQAKMQKVKSIIVRGHKIKIADPADDVFAILNKQDQISQKTLPDKKLGSLFVIKDYKVDGKTFKITFARTEDPGPYRVISIEK